MPDMTLRELGDEVLKICQKPYGEATLIEMELVNEYNKLPASLHLSATVKVSERKDLWLAGIKRMNSLSN